MWGKILSWIVGKKDLLSPFKVQIIVGVIAGLVVIVWLHLWSDSRREAVIEALMGQNAVLRQTRDQLVHTLNQNNEVLEACSKAAEENAKARSDVAMELERAKGEIRILSIETNDELEDIEREAAEFKPEISCPAYDNEFRQWLFE